MKDNLGFGVMINMLGGNEETVNTIKTAIGKTIKTVELLDEDNVLRFVFSDGIEMHVWDDGQSCCEVRYLHTDDDLSFYKDCELLSISTEDAPNMPDEYGDHEVQFLHVKTSLGSFTVETHNEHNGYYGGFWVVATFVDDGKKPA